MQVEAFTFSFFASPGVCPVAGTFSTTFSWPVKALFLNVAVYVVLPIPSQVGCVVTADVVCTVSVSVWDASRVQTLVAVTLLLSVDQLYVGVPQLWPSASTFSTTFVWVLKALFVNVAV